jgi:hypothetical protein
LSKFLILAFFYGVKTMFQLKTSALALMGAASPDLEKQGF